MRETNTSRCAILEILQATSQAIFHDNAFLSMCVDLAWQIYCYGELLEAVQLSGLFQDSKEFVDMPMKYDPEVILEVGGPWLYVRASK
jgi:hypothetical protein